MRPSSGDQASRVEAVLPALLASGPARSRMLNRLAAVSGTSFVAGVPNPKVCSPKTQGRKELAGGDLATPKWIPMKMSDVTVQHDELAGLADNARLRRV